MESAVAIFTKVPIPGLVKTRLSQDTCLTELDSSKIAEAMVKDTIGLSSTTQSDRIQIGYYPSENVNKLNEIISSLKLEGYLNKPVELILQCGSDFNQRFGSIVKESFRKGVDFLVILGADLPFLDPKVIDNTLLCLANNLEDPPVIIGPSSGGGVYLVGITRAFHYNWFSKYNLFGDGPELSNFSKFCKDNRIPLITLPPYGDIDIEEDLVSLISYISILKNSEKTIGFYYPRYTANVIDDLKLYIINQDAQTRRRKIAKRTNN
ncbi:MAG: DUF2064 domain-containing protein [Candidatus Thorarchaeota archaeon]